MEAIKSFIKDDFLLLLLIFIFLIDPFHKGIYVGYLLFFWLLAKPKFWKSSLDKRGVILFSFSSTYALFYSLNPHQSHQFTFIYALFPVVFYLIGKYFSYKYSSYNVYLFLFFFITVCFSFVPALSIIINIVEMGFDFGNRNLSLLWDENEIFSATGLGSYFTLNMALFGSVFVKKRFKFELVYFFFSVVIFLISFICVIRLGSRTQLTIAGFSLVSSLLYILPKQRIDRSILLLIFITSIISVILDQISFNSDWMTYFSGRMSDEGNFTSAGGRFKKWVSAVEYLIINPIGWTDPTIGYAHNLWLDVSRVAGILPFVLLSLFTILNIPLIRDSLTKSRNNYYFNTIVLSSFLGFLLIFFVEPVMEGMFMLFLIYCFYSGFLSGYKEEIY